MTEEYWQSYKKKKDLQGDNQFLSVMQDMQRVKLIRDQHPDKLYSICKTDNNYWRHYRAS